MKEGLLCAVSLLLLVRFSVPQNVICYEHIDKNKGECMGILADDVSEEDCCLNINYGFKRDHTGSCEACHVAEWSEWTPWFPCTVPCLEGVKQRRRACYGKGECPDASKTETIQTAPCIEKTCCPVSGGWSVWLGWSACSVTCGKGSKTRKRICNNPLPACDGSCEGSGTDVDQCEVTTQCPTHGNWDSWQSWGQCFGTCKDEAGHQVPIQTRQRTCSNPPPSVNPPGNPCVGPAEEQRQCSWLPFCPVNGNWGPWGAWSDCPVTCGVGRQTRNRECNNPAPRHNGQPCPGSSILYKSCTVKTNCPVSGNGIWPEWSTWSNCYPHCGSNAKKRRTKICQPIYPNYTLIIQTPTKKNETVVFWGTPRQFCAPIGSVKYKFEEELSCLNVPDCED
ncbi:properdin isoform X2 [Protopterus annectens]|uniref:properdin isoform X2 n=1 Tax=Protopterus annectens TaxID=7888 RepID=UPI001CFBFC41|nr:properdin isoform X2 [Protopterus annectens]